MERLEVLIVGNYRPDSFADMAGEAAIHLQAPEDRRPSPCLERIQAAVAGYFPAEWLEKAPRLRQLFIPFAGLPPELRESLAQRPELTVSNTHFASAFVAEHVFACLLRLNRNLDELDRSMRRPQRPWRSSPPARFVTLQGKTMGIVGRGHVGQAVERLAQAFGMEVRFHTRADFQADRKDGGERLLDLLGWSDVVVLAVPLTPETAGLIGGAEFSAMRPDALLVNVSRGEIVVERALYRALKRGTIRGAAVDTWYNYRDGFFNPERPYSKKFHRFSSLLMTPHVAYRSDDLERARIEEIKNFIRAVRRGDPPGRAVDLTAGY